MSLKTQMQNTQTTLYQQQQKEERLSDIDLYEIAFSFGYTFAWDVRILFGATLYLMEVRTKFYHDTH